MITGGPGTVGIHSDLAILNVGSGDTKLSFDPNSPQDCIRAARIVKDMLRRGYALLVEVTQPDASKKFQRVFEFDDTKYEYIIADFDPEIVAVADQQEITDEEDQSSTAAAPTENGAKASKPRLRGRTKRIPASGARAVSIGRTAGG